MRTRVGVLQFAGMVKVGAGGTANVAERRIIAALIK
jgi:hypothetical protein